MHTTTKYARGRLCNQLIRNLAISFIAEKIDLYVEYNYYDEIAKLGIPLFIGSMTYPSQFHLTDENFLETLQNTPKANIYTDEFFQTRMVCRLIWEYFRKPIIKTNIVSQNPYNIRYGKNQDCFVHVRLGDTIEYGYNPGFQYYCMVLDHIQPYVGTIFIATDSPEHEIPQGLLQRYSNAIFYLEDPLRTIQFGSTCKYLVLSHGSYSATIGWLGYDSEVYYPEYMADRMWHGDMFSIDGWNKIVGYR